MICYFHSDLDGYCAAAIVLKKYPECRMREIDHRDNPNFSEEVETGETVFIVDFSFKPKKMIELFKLTAPVNIIWIDHHKTAKDYKYLECPGTGRHIPPLPGLRDFSEPGKSGCELTWEYLFPEEPMPEAVRLLGDYDTWRFDTEEESKLFQMGMKLYSTYPKQAIWQELLENFSSGVVGIISMIVRSGGLVTTYRDNFCADYRQSFGWEVKFEGYNCFVMNIYTLGSPGFGPEMDNQDICIACVYSDGIWTVGLYSEKVDVSIIAKKYGGGGHTSAAGFICDKLPF
jgi:oligoribonuclease NrnB/cAMP/cGMP phosphodiesterase (DHH superfamily)